MKSKDLKEDFILDAVTIFVAADKIKPFFEKHCKQRGAIPNTDTLRTLCV